jgi:hypothetical protein
MADTPQQGLTDVDPFAITRDVPLDVMVPEEVADAPAMHALRVHPDNVLQTAKVMIDLLEREESTIVPALQRLRIEAMAQDPVSSAAAEAWNRILLDDPDSYTERVTRYLRNLHDLVHNLIDTAKGYGYTEDQISAVLEAVPA